MKLQVLQKHARDLKDRETRLAHEKMLFSKERLEVEAMVKKARNNRCSLCKIGERSLELTGLALGESTTNEEDLFKDTVDLDIETSLQKLRGSTWEELAEINLDHIPNFSFDSDPDLQLFKFDALNIS